MRALLLLVASLPPPVDACGVSIPQANATAFSPDDAVGHRPWIELEVIGIAKIKAVRVTQADCPVRASLMKDRSSCTGVPVALESHGRYVRPKAGLPDGARLQLQARGKDIDMAGDDADATWVLADVRVRKGAAQPLPAWDGVSVVAARIEKPISECALGGPKIELAIKQTKADLDGTVLLVSRTKPDRKQPLATLDYIARHGDGKATLGNQHGHSWLPKGQTQLWVMLADDDGNTSEPVAITFTLK